MAKDETTKAVEKVGRKIEKGVVRSPSDKNGTQQMVNQIKEDVKQMETAEENKEEKKEHIKQKEKPKKTEAVVNARDIPISTKNSAAICMFIKRKRISKAIEELEQVAKIKMAVPMKGEIPHRRGEGMMSGRFPQKAAKEFIILLKSLGANANYNGIEEPIITEAKANIGARPFGRAGIRRKRTHITLIAKAYGGKK